MSTDPTDLFEAQEHQPAPVQLLPAVDQTWPNYHIVKYEQNLLTECMDQIYCLDSVLQ